MREFLEDFRWVDLADAIGWYHLFDLAVVALVLLFGLALVAFEHWRLDRKDRKYMQARRHIF